MDETRNKKRKKVWAMSIRSNDGQDTRGNRNAVEGNAGCCRNSPKVPKRYDGRQKGWAIKISVEQSLSTGRVVARRAGGSAVPKRSKWRQRDGGESKSKLKPSI
jgi:hypothetical protein